MKQRVVVLGLGRGPDEDEQALIESLREEGCHARYVFAKGSDELEPCHKAYSKHEDLLEGYKVSEVVSKPSGEHEADVSSEVVVDFGLPEGYSIERAGAYLKLFDEDGEQVGKARYEQDMRDFVETL